MANVFKLGSNRGWSLPALVQLGVATLGVVILAWGIYGLVFVFGSMPRSESGFAEGLALIIYGMYMIAGFVLVAAGLLVPQRAESGIQFRPRERTLLRYGVVAPIVGVLLVGIWAQFGSVAGTVGSAVLGLLVLGIVVSGAIATLLAIGSKLARSIG